MIRTLHFRKPKNSNNYLSLFSHFMEDDMESDPQREERDIPKDTIDTIIGIDN